MGLYHSVDVVYGFEIPATTDFDHLDQVLDGQPDSNRVHHTYLGDFERLFLYTESKDVTENEYVRLTAADFGRYEISAWNTALHAIAVRLGHEQHEEPAWLVLHNYS